MRRITFLILFFLSSILSFAQSPARSFWITDNGVFAIVSDGSNYYIGGDFNYVGPNTANLAIISTTSTEPNLSFPNVNGDIYCMISDGNGGVYIGGDFTKVGDSTRYNLAHITSTYTVDEWQPNPDNFVNTLTLDNGKLYVGGGFYRIAGINQTYKNLARFDVSDGTLDSDWQPQPNYQVRAIIVNGSDIYLGGDFTSLSSESIERLAKVNNTDGSADASWAPNPNASVYTLVTDGTYLYCGGGFTQISSLSIKNLARVELSDGSTDSTWKPEPNDIVNSIFYDSPYLYIGGQFTSICNEARSYVAKLNTSCSLSSWSATVNNAVKMITVANGFVYIGGQFKTVNSTMRYGLARLGTSNGNLDGTWDPDVHSDCYTQTSYDGEPGLVYCMVKNSDDIIIGGRFISLNGLRRSKIAKIASNGKVDSSWHSGNINDRVTTIVLDGSEVYIGGYFTQIGTTTRNRLAKLSSSDGSLNADWVPNADYNIETLAVTSGSVFCGGVFWNVGGQARNSIAKLNKTDGTADANWQANTGSGETVYSLAVNGSYIFAGGNFSSIGGESVSKIAKIDTTTGSVDTNWVQADNYVYSLAVINSDLYVGGTFSQIAGVGRTYLAKLNPNTGAADENWSPNLNNAVYGISEVGSNILIGGNFTSVNSETHKYVAILNSTDGSPVSAFAPKLDGGVKAVDGSTGNALVGGVFVRANDSYQRNIAFFSERNLPVELVSFIGYAGTNDVILVWQTATEINNYGFQIERKKGEDKNKWEKIGFVKGSGNSNSPKEYSFTDKTVESGKYSYRLKQIDLSGNYEYSKTIEINIALPDKFILSQNYPNPFNPTTVIKYTIPSVQTRQALSVQLIVYDVLGRKVATLLKKKQKPGKYSIKFDASNFASGIYFYRLQAGRFESIKKMVLLK